MKRTTTMMALATALIQISNPAAGQAGAQAPAVPATAGNVPAGFAERDSRPPNDFLIESGLDYGVRL